MPMIARTLNAAAAASAAGGALLLVLGGRQFLAPEPLVEFIPRLAAVGLLAGGGLLFLFALGMLVLGYRRSIAVRDTFTGKQQRALEFHKKVLDTHTIALSWNSEGKITTANANFDRSFDMASDEIIGQPLSVLYGHRHLDEDYLTLMRAMNEGRVWHGEQRMRNGSGGTVYLEVTAAPDHDRSGLICGGTAMMTDVSALLEAESDQFLGAMLEELSDEVFVFDTETLYVHYMNAAARIRCGWERDEVREHRIVDTDPNFSEEAMRTHTAPLLAGTKSVVSVTVENPEGPVEITTHLFESGNGRKFFVAVVRDLSDRRAVENARMQSVSVVSHELRAPLTSIKGSLRLLQSGVMGSLPQEANAVVDIACRNSDRLLMVVNDILDLDKIQSGKMDFAMKPIDLRDLVGDAMEMNQGYADEHNVKLASDLPEGAPMIEGNADRLMQVLTNLMTNAVKFSPEEGEVVVKVRRKGGNWRVSVVDRGPGIPESSRKYLGQPFAQLVPADGRKRAGTGLGLTIVKSIVQRHNGVFGVDSTVGKGSEFYFDLPACSGEEQTAEQDAIAEAS